MFGVERRKQYRVGMDMPVAIGIVGAEGQCGGRLGARLVDISSHGALLILDGLPRWRFSEVLGGNAPMQLDIDLRRYGSFSPNASIQRISALEDSCEVAVRFVGLSGADRKRLQSFLSDYLAREADDEVRNRHRRHSRRMLRQHLVVAALVAVAGVALTFLCISLVESLPEWFSKGKSALYEEARQVRRAAIEDQLRSMRESGKNPAKVYESFTPEERERIKGMLTEDERREIRRALNDSTYP